MCVVLASSKEAARVLKNGVGKRKYVVKLWTGEQGWIE